MIAFTKMVRRVYATQHPQHCVPRREGHRWRFFPHERLQSLRATQHDGRIREEQRRPRSRARRWRFGRNSLLRWTEPTPWVSPDHRSGTVGDFPSGCLVRHPQLLDGSRPTSKAGRDGQLPKKHGHTRSAANDLGHPAAVADESRSLIRDNCRNIETALTDPESTDRDAVRTSAAHSLALVRYDRVSPATSLAEPSAAAIH